MDAFDIIFCILLGMIFSPVVGFAVFISLFVFSALRH